ncbi:MAG: glycosyltransferase family 2 protein [Fibrobacter sp.]|nr:glycosyltransferase family 2 protein [Fibrobacter sp.]
MKVAVVIPTRNRVQMLKQAVESVYRSTFSDLEVVVVDDSTISELDYDLENYLKSKGTKYIRSGGNRGGGYCRNLGIQATSSEYIAFLDDDDRWEPSKLEKQILMMKEKNESICYTGINICKNSSKSFRYSFHYPRYKDHYKSIMAKNFIGTTSSVVVTRKIIEKTGGFDVNLQALQDYDLYIRILKRSSVVWINQPLTVYNDNDLPDKVSSSTEYYKQAASYLKEKYSEDPYWPVLKKSLKNIKLLKMFRSRRFLHNTLRILVNR